MRNATISRFRLASPKFLRNEFDAWRFSCWGCWRPGNDAMPTPNEHRQHAQECLALASEAYEVYVKVALAELAQAYSHMADDLERATSANVGAAL